MSQIKYLFIVIILCVVMAYMYINFNVTFETDADFKKLTTRFKNDFIIIESDKYFPYKLDVSNGIIMSPTARLLCDPSRYIVDSNNNLTNNIKQKRSIVNWTDGWIEVLGDRCNKHICTNSVRNKLYGGSHVITYESIIDKKTNVPIATASPGFLISTALHPNHKIKFYQREHSTFYNFTSVVTITDLKIQSYPSLMLYIATVQTNNKSLQQCAKNINSLFVKSNKNPASVYPFSGLNKIGLFSITTAIKEQIDPKQIILNAVHGCKISDVSISTRNEHYVYKFIVHDKSIDIAPVQHAVGPDKSIQLTFVSIDHVNNNTIDTSDAISIMQNDDSVSFQENETESANDIQSDSEFEDIDQKPLPEIKTNDVTNDETNIMKIPKNIETNMETSKNMETPKNIEQNITDVTM